MSYYQNLNACIDYLQALERQKLMLMLLNVELSTGYRPSILDENSIIDRRYQYFKYRYLNEIATSVVLKNTFIDMLETNQYQYKVA